MNASEYEEIEAGARLQSASTVVQVMDRCNGGALGVAVRVAAVVDGMLYPYAEWFPLFWLSAMGWRQVQVREEVGANA